MAGLIRSGKLDRRVRILQPGAPVDDGQQTLPGGFVEAGQRWAWVKPKMGREPIEAQGREARTPMSFWLRFDSLTRTIGADWALEMEGVHYSIIAPPIEVGRREGIEVLGVAGGLPAQGVV